MGYCIHTVTQLPEVVSITLAVGCAVNTMKSQTLLNYCHELTQLIRKLRTQYGLQDLAQLGKRQIWDQVVAEWTPSLSKHKLLSTYDTLTSLHLRGYLEGLSIRDRAIWEVYAFPPLPAGFLHKYGQLKAAHLATQQRRREQVDVLVPLFPLLVELAYLRKQAAERLVSEFRRQKARAEVGEIVLPYHFQYTEHRSRLYGFRRCGDPCRCETHRTRDRSSIDALGPDSWAEAHLGRYGHHTQLSWKQ
jgi:hypothetical protein